MMNTYTVNMDAITFYVSIVKGVGKKKVQEQ